LARQRRALCLHRDRRDPEPFFVALKRSVILSTILIVAMGRDGRRVLAMASHSDHKRVMR
jgi:hypothetical protein